ncbi:MAG TPA: glycosyltransferase family 39 protein [Candidatus Saccharimonadales bacterium]|nr:glycosyltransferase family 39 protein [Candidatus Saccharimonadales bacterium]
MTDLPFVATVNPRRLLAGLADRISSGSLMLIGLAGLGFAGHMLVASNYGYFRDELYYIAAGHHLALGYVDFPLLMAFLAWGLGLLAGDSLLTLHVIPALASSLLILVTGLTARELGGSKLAQALAASASLVCLTFLATGSIFSMDSLDELWWTLIAYLLVRLLRRSTPRLWLLIGAVAGLGMLTKVTILFFLAALALGLLATPARAEFKTRWPWLALGIAGAGLAPYLVWEFQNGWPTLTYWHNYLGTLVSLSPLSFVGQQAYVMNPITLPLWLGGEVWLLRGGARPRLRALGLAFAVLFVWFCLTPSKSYYLAPAYPFLFAAGGVWLAPKLRRLGARWPGTLCLGLMALSGALLAPIAMPILPPATFASAYGFLGTDAGAQMEQHRGAPLPQWLADRFGWVSLSHRVAGAIRELPRQERLSTCIFAANYGEAAALDFLGRGEHLPPAISGDNSFYFWGPGHCTGRSVITVGVPLTQVWQSFASVRVLGRSRCAYCMPAENGVPILLARDPKHSIAQLWKTVEDLS